MLKKLLLIIGAAAAVVFAVFWFNSIAGGCGVVRIYEQLYGILVLAVWLVVSLLSLRITSKSGLYLSAVVSLGMLAFCVQTVTDLWYMDFSAKSTEEILKLAARPGAKARDSAILELGVRKISGAVPLLCSILQDEQAPRAERANAANALGRICDPWPENTDKDLVLSALIFALQSPNSDSYPDIEYQAVWALSRIKDPRAFQPLQDLIYNKNRPLYLREAAEKALTEIGGAAGKA